jgi:hypothetical protein
MRVLINLGVDVFMVAASERHDVLLHARAFTVARQPRGSPRS